MIAPLLVAAFTAFHVATSLVWKEFDRDTALNGMVFTDHLVFQTAARSKLDCGRQCSNRPCCAAFTFTAMTSEINCRGHSSTMTSLNAYVRVTGARSYIRDRTQIPRNCAEAVKLGYGCHEQQIVDISQQLTGISVSCVHDWTVILRRQSDRVYFFRGWQDYVTGFGDVAGDHWLGLEAIHQLTSQDCYDLRVELEDWEGLTATADYVGFALASAADNYRLQVDNFTGGSAGDSLTQHDGFQFSTMDVDNDNTTENCATRYVGAWWYNSCHVSNLCGEFKPSSFSEYGRGVQWHSWRGYYYSLQFAQMMIRPSVSPPIEQFNQMMITPSV